MLQVHRACRIALSPYSTGTPGLQNRFIPLLYRYTGLAESLYPLTLQVHFARKAAGRTCTIDQNSEFYSTICPVLGFMYM